MKKILRRFAKSIEGHFSIGNLTVFGDNAMHFGCHYWTKKYGYICFRLPIPCGITDKISYGRGIYWVPLYFYISPNAALWGATYVLGPRFTYQEKTQGKSEKDCSAITFNMILRMRISIINF